MFPGSGTDSADSIGVSLQIRCRRTLPMLLRPFPGDRSLFQGRLRARRGVITLELILFLPVLVILLLLIIEFAIIYQVNKQVAYASNFGAKLASEITREQAASINLGNYNLESTPNNLKERIDQVLANHGLTASCAVILEHNACGVPNNIQRNPDPIPGDCNCGPPEEPLPAGEPPVGTAYVRVTVCLKLEGNVPDLLSTLGFALGDRTFEHSTVKRIETNNQFPEAVITVPQQMPTLSDSSAFDSITPDIRFTPVTSPPTPTITFSVPNLTATNATFNLDFHAGASSDPEDPFADLEFNWNTDASPIPPTDEEDFSATFTVPGTGGSGDGAAITYFVTLTVTDTCGEPSQQTININVIRNE
jgi:hypothetical protein